MTWQRTTPSCKYAFSRQPELWEHLHFCRRCFKEEASPFLIMQIQPILDVDNSKPHFFLFLFFFWFFFPMAPGGEEPFLLHLYEFLHCTVLIFRYRYCLVLFCLKFTAMKQSILSFLFHACRKKNGWF